MRDGLFTGLLLIAAYVIPRAEARHLHSFIRVKTAQRQLDYWEEASGMWGFVIIQVYACCPSFAGFMLVLLFPRILGSPSYLFVLLHILKANHKPAHMHKHIDPC